MLTGGVCLCSLHNAYIAFHTHDLNVCGSTHCCDAWSMAQLLFDILREIEYCSTNFSVYRHVPCGYPYEPPKYIKLRIFDIYIYMYVHVRTCMYMSVCVFKFFLQAWMDKYFARILSLSTNEELPPRIRFMLLDVADLRKGNVRDGFKNVVHSFLDICSKKSTKIHVHMYICVAIGF